MTTSVTDRERAEVVAAVEAIVAALDQYVAALEGVAGDLPDPGVVIDTARTWREMAAAQVELWATFRDRHRG